MGAGWGALAGGIGGALAGYQKGGIKGLAQEGLLVQQQVLL